MIATLEDRRAKADAELDARCVRALKRLRSLPKAAKAPGVKLARVRLAIERAGLGLSPESEPESRAAFNPPAVGPEPGRRPGRRR